MLAELERFHRSAPGELVDATDVVAPHLRLGSPAASAFQKLEDNGFKKISSTATKAPEDTRPSRQSTEYVLYRATRNDVAIYKDIYSVVIGQVGGRVDFLHASLQRWSL